MYGTYNDQVGKVQLSLPLEQHVALQVILTQEEMPHEVGIDRHGRPVLIVLPINLPRIYKLALKWGNSLNGIIDHVQHVTKTLESYVKAPDAS